MANGIEKDEFTYLDYDIESHRCVAHVVEEIYYIMRTSTESGIKVEEVLKRRARKGLAVRSPSGLHIGSRNIPNLPFGNPSVSPSSWLVIVVSRTLYGFI